MRKLIFIIGLLIAPIFLMAQQSKKVAVWETKCNGEGISSFKSGLVRGGMEEAVDNTPGYIKYDRAMFDALLEEHKFQQSGAVKDEDIRSMGKMASVQYVIVPEVSLEESYFLIVVRIIDVETGQSKTAKELCGATPLEIDKACAKLAARLFENHGDGRNIREKDVSSTIGHEKDYTETAFGINMRMVYVEGGTFDMGCTGEQGNDCEDDEKNVRHVTIDGFYIGMLEVTQSEWCKVFEIDEHELFSIFYGDVWDSVRKANSFMVDTANVLDDWDMQEIAIALSSGYSIGDTAPYSTYDGGRISRFDSHWPIYAVDYEQAIDFCRRLSEKTGRHYSLPSEAQWEYAARGGIKSRGTKFAGSNTIGDVAWYKDNSEEYVRACGTRQPNELGIYDMCGNVSEWCLDCYEVMYLKYENTNPCFECNELGCSHIVRGGDVSDCEARCRVSARGGLMVEVMYPRFVGFRVVCIP